MAAATEKLAQRIRADQARKVKVYDKTTPSQGHRSGGRNEVAFAL
ncbi:hypothetical protein RHDC3_01999 [Rhodocyclaceae bacterium]|nr:hypothetical protein RHDC3_01999 [Rhodocyclaceae bacterium]